MNNSKLWIMCGLSGSGKSTIAAKLAAENPNTIIISIDAIREELTGDYSNQEYDDEVFRLFHDRIRKNLENKYNVIADATNITIKSRRAILDKVNGLNIEKICYLIPKPFGQCKIDNLDREYPVPEYVLDKQIRKFQIPFYEEGFDKIIIHKEDKWIFTYGIRAAEMFQRMYGFDQRNPHHTMTLADHCENAYKLFWDNKCPHTIRDVIPENSNAFAMGAKLHDIGKLITQTFDENNIAHYYAHEQAGCYLVFSQLKLPNFWTNDMLLDCCFLINYHMMPFSWTSDKARRKWQRRFGEYKYKMLMDFNECDRAR